MPKILKTIWEGWKKVAKVIGKVNSVIILTIFYFTIVAPIGIVRRIINLFKRKDSPSSFWQDYKSPSGEDFTKQF